MLISYNRWCPLGEVGPQHGSIGVCLRLDGTTVEPDGTILPRRPDSSSRTAAFSLPTPV